MATISLNNLKVGEMAVVTKIKIEDKALKRRILDMGIVKGVTIKVIRTAPLGDPVEIEVRNYMLSVRKADLSFIEGEVLSKKQIKELEK